MFEFRSLELVHWDYWQRFQLPLDASIVNLAQALGMEWSDPFGVWAHG